MVESNRGRLYFGDNLEVLREHIPTESIDLIYLDPPFNSKANYNVLFKTKSGKDAPAQIQAFSDTWKWGLESEKIYHYILNIGDRVADVLNGLRSAVGENDMMAYVTMMAIRFIELHRVLKLTGSIFVHCDSTASHYLKIILDSIFDTENFRNEIIWKRTNSPKSQTNAFGTQHDVILWYSKSMTYTYNKITRGLDIKSVKPFRHDDKDGRGPYQTVALVAGGLQRAPTRKSFEFRGVTEQWLYTKEALEKMWTDGIIYETRNGKYRKKDYLKDKKERGILISDIWVDEEVAPIQSKERLGYPTQKPISLLERIISVGSNKGDTVLDPFCGCGTTVHAAQKLGRKYIGIDVTHLAVGLIEYRMKESFGIRPEVIGVPTTLESAQELADRDKFQFEAWAVTRIDGIAPNQKRGKDRGIDGRGYIVVGFDNNNQPKYEKIIVSVKGGNQIGPAMVRDLKGVVEREKATFGIFVCIKEPTPEMKREAATGGMFKIPVGPLYPKIQIYTIQDYFYGKKPKLPHLDNHIQEIAITQTQANTSSKISSWM